MPVTLELFFSLRSLNLVAGPLPAPGPGAPTQPHNYGPDERRSNHRSALTAVLSVTPVQSAMRLAGYPRPRSHAARAAIRWYMGGSPTFRRARASTSTATVRMLSWRVHHQMEVAPGSEPRQGSDLRAA